MKTRQSSVCLFILLFFLTNALAQDRIREKKPSGDEIQTYPAYALFEKLLESPHQISVHQFSSHNKKGLNGDENWPLYKDENGDDVIFDATGPGCIKSMWGTNFDTESVIKFYFDGVKQPRYSINYIDFYKGGHAVFPSPLVSYEKRGMWGDRPYAGNSFVPIPFEKSLKITVQGMSRFFHIIYEKYPYKTSIKSFTGEENRSVLEDCYQRFGDAPIKSEGLEVFETKQDEIKPGQKISLLKLENRSGVIRKIIIEADGSVDCFQKTVIRMKWDGHLRWDVFAPTGIFFGFAVEADDMRSLPLRVEKLENGRIVLSCFFPMPFWSQAEIEWLNNSQHRMAPLSAKIFVSTNTLNGDSGNYFTTLYHEGITTYGRDWPLFEGVGTGWFVGVVQSMQNAHYCEGDEHFYLDEAVSPQINGTGSEDYYLACFWPDVDFDTPFGCVVGDIQKQGGGHLMGAYQIPSCYSRFHLEAPIPFYSSIKALIQHGGLSHIHSNYRSLAFCYINKHPILRQSDLIDVGNPISEKTHRYRALSVKPPVYLSAHPEGENFETLLEECGRYHSKGDIHFAVSIDPKNVGVRLRRRIDQKIPRQKANVYIDEKYAGCWYSGYENEHLRWFDLDFDIHSDYTAGKNSIDVRLEIESNERSIAFTDFKYEIYCFLK